MKQWPFTTAMQAYGVNPQALDTGNFPDSIPITGEQHERSFKGPELLPQKS